MRRKMRGKTTSIISGIVLVALVAGVLALAVSLLGKDTKSIGAGKFDVGAINAEGVYVKNDQSIYTKDLIECQGLSIEPDFEATGTYQVFYYGEDKNFIGSTEVMNAEDGVYSKFSTFGAAKYCRIMITPDPVTEDGEEDEDFKIRFYQVAGYANDYTISVNKKQNFKLVNIWENGEIVFDKIGSYDKTTLKFTETDGTSNYNKVDVTGANRLKLVFVDGVSFDYSYVIFDADGNKVIAGEFPTGYEEVYVDVPANASFIVVNFGDAQDIELYVVG